MHELKKSLLLAIAGNFLTFTSVSYCTDNLSFDESRPEKQITATNSQASIPGILSEETDKLMNFILKERLTQISCSQKEEHEKWILPGKEKIKEWSNVITVLKSRACKLPRETRRSEIENYQKDLDSLNNNITILLDAQKEDQEKTRRLISFIKEDMEIYKQGKIQDYIHFIKKYLENFIENYNAVFEDLLDGKRNSEQVLESYNGKFRKFDIIQMFLTNQVCHSYFQYLSSIKAQDGSFSGDYTQGGLFTLGNGKNMG